MSAKSEYISDRRFRKFPGGLRFALISLLGRRDRIVGQYACNVQPQLRALGVPELADDLEDEMGSDDDTNTSWRQAARDWPNG